MFGLMETYFFQNKWQHHLEKEDADDSNDIIEVEFNNITYEEDYDDD